LHDAPRAEADVLQPARAKFASLQASPSHGLLNITNDVAERLGDRALQSDTVRRMAEVATTLEERATASLMQARVLDALGHREHAERALEAAYDGFRQTGMERESVIARAHIADILQSRGQLDEALRLLRDEVLSAFERLGVLV
jgi:tetratricopeptide (TPR) repeat protein